MVMPTPLIYFPPCFLHSLYIRMTVEWSEESKMGKQVIVRPHHQSSRKATSLHCQAGHMIDRDLLLT